jgi:hypothetical protein
MTEYDPALHYFPDKEMRPAPIDQEIQALEDGKN